MTAFTENDRKLMAPAHIDLGKSCEWCSLNQVREGDLKAEAKGWAVLADDLRAQRDAERLTVADQGKTIDILAAQLRRDNGHFWLAMFGLGLVVGYMAYQVRP